MPTRTTETVVTFDRPFTLPSIGSTQPPGRYTVVIDEDEILGLSFLVYQRVATTFRLPALETSPLAREAYLITPRELAEALASDALRADPRAARP